jgi:sucrose-phosphate synthase
VRVAFLNPQGNFDPSDRGWAEHPDFGGQLVYVKETALAMAAAGHKVDILTRQMEDAQWPEFADRFDSYAGQAGVRIVRLPCGPKHFLKKEELWPHLAEWVDRIEEFYRAEGANPDTTTAHYGDGGLAAVLLEERCGVPFTLTGHSLGAQKLDKLLAEGRALPHLLEELHFDKRLAAERLSMARAGRIITSTRQERFQQYGHTVYRGAVDPENEAKFAVIAPGVNLEVFDQSAHTEVEDSVASKVEAMLDRDIPPERRGLPIVICSSRLEPKKNHIALVRAWAEDARLREVANLVIVVRGSSDPLRQTGAHKGTTRTVIEELLAIIRKNELWPAISAFDLNSQSELAAAYRHLGDNYRGIFSLTAVYEPFGLAPLEAMAAGLPAVVTMNGGPSETLRDGKTEYGVLVNPEDPIDIANGISRLATDPEEWSRLKRLGRQRVANRFTWERTAAGYVEVLQQLLAGETAANRSYAKPRYFEHPLEDDVNAEWLWSVYPLQRR